MAKTKRKMGHCEVKQWLRGKGISFEHDFFVLGDGDLDKILEGSRLSGYRKSRNAPGSTARMYYYLLDRKSCVGDGKRRR